MKTQRKKSHTTIIVIASLATISIILFIMWFYNKKQNEKQFNESLAKRFDETMVQAYPAVNYCAQAIYIQKDYLERNAMIAKNQNPYNYQGTFKYLNRQTRLDDIFYARQYINSFKTGLIYSILTSGGNLRKKETEAFVDIIYAIDKPEYPADMDPNSLIIKFNQIKIELTENLKTLSKYYVPGISMDAWRSVDDMKHAHI